MDPQQQSYDPSQIQPYDPSSYYPYYQYDHQYPYYANSYQQQQQQDPPSIHPPGVPIPPESQLGTGQINAQNQQAQYYSQGVDAQIQQFDPSQPAAAYPAVTLAPASSQQQWQGNNVGYVPPMVHGGQYQPIGQAPYASRGRRGGGPTRGGRSSTSFRGKGRGSGRRGNLAAPANNPATALQGHPPSAPVWPPPRMAWCELCRVDCNTLEILEQHKNGKKHKKNLKVQEELQKLNKRLIEEQSQQVPVPVPEVKQEVEGSKGKNPMQENLSSQAVPDESNLETEQQKASEGVEPTAETGRGRGGKRKMRGGGRVAGKRPRTSEGSKRPIEAPKSKQMISLVCEMCNVKCESEVVFGSHIRGKKHLSTLRRFQGQQEMIGQAALQALYPALQALYPALQALYPPNPNPTAFFPPQASDQNPQPVPPFFHAGEGSGLSSVLENQDTKAEHIQVVAAEVGGQQTTTTANDVQVKD